MKDPYSILGVSSDATDDEVKNGERVRKVKKIYKAEVCYTDSFGSLGI